MVKPLASIRCLSMKPSERLAALNLSLPEVVAPVGSYVPALRSGRHVITSGQLPFRDGQVVCKGKVPGDVSVEEAAEGKSRSVTQLNRPQNLNKRCHAGFATVTTFGGEFSVALFSTTLPNS